MTEREVYGVLDFIGDVGGLLEFMYIVIGLMAFKFSRLKVAALLTSNLSIISTKEKKKVANEIYLKSPEKLLKKDNGDFILQVPKYLDWEQLWSFCCCFIRNQTYKDYTELVKKGADNYSQGMDIVTFVRRKRMHGYGLLFLLNRRFRDLSAALAERKPLDDLTSFLKKDRWAQIEGL